MGFKGGINQYAYTGNNPVNWIDPFGLRDYTILDWPDPFLTPFQAYDFRNTMRKDFSDEYLKTGNECLKNLSVNYSFFRALIDMYRFSEQEALDYYKKKCSECPAIQ